MTTKKNFVSSLAVGAGVIAATSAYLLLSSFGKSKNETKVEYPAKDSYKYSEGVGRILFSSQDIANRVKEIGEQISRDYNGKPLVLVGLMKGCYHFLSDLSRHITIPHEIDIIGVTTYDGTKSSHSINLYHELDIDVKNKHILIIEDLVDTAFTLNWVLNSYFTQKKTGYASLNACCLLDKFEAKKVPNYEENVKPLIKYIGFKVENVFVVGYGMDYNQHYRSLPFIGVLNREVYKSDWSKTLQSWHSATKDYDA